MEVNKFPIEIVPLEQLDPAEITSDSLIGHSLPGEDMKKAKVSELAEQVNFAPIFSNDSIYI